MTSKGCGIKPVATGTSLTQSGLGTLGNVPQTVNDWGTGKLGYAHSLPTHPWLMALPWLLNLWYCSSSYEGIKCAYTAVGGGGPPGSHSGSL